MGIAGGICALLGFVLLMVSRGRMEGSGSAWTPILTALVLLVMGGTALARTFSQLRFFFGRGLPRNLMRPKSHYETPKAIDLSQRVHPPGAGKEARRHRGFEDGPRAGDVFTAVGAAPFARRPNGRAGRTFREARPPPQNRRSGHHRHRHAGAPGSITPRRSRCANTTSPWPA